MARQTMDQQRAAHAYRYASQCSGDADFLKKLPVLIQTCGLGQALAFMEAKGKGLKIREALEDWTTQVLPPDGGARQGLLQRAVHGDSDFLRRATEESLAYLSWLGRLVEAL